MSDYYYDDYDDYDDDGMYGGEMWGTTMNTSGFMAFVDKVWILINRIVVILVFIVVILSVILFIVGYPPIKQFVVQSSEGFRRRH